MNEQETRFEWRPAYTIVLVANFLYILVFYWIMSIFS